MLLNVTPAGRSRLNPFKTVNGNAETGAGVSLKPIFKVGGQPVVHLLNLCLRSHFVRSALEEFSHFPDASVVPQSGD